MGTHPCNLNTWNDIVIQRSGTTVKAYLDATLDISTTSSANLSDGTLTIGKAGVQYVSGYIDEFRISDIARYSDGFTVPNAAFTSSSTAYPVNTPYYITTTNASHIDLSAFDTIAGATVTATVPANTTLAYLVSFDGRASWYSWTGSAWASVALSAANIIASGMSGATLQTALANWTPAQGTTLDIAAAFKTSDAAVTPSLDNILVTTDSYSLLRPVTDYTVTKLKAGSQTLTLTRVKAGNANHEIVCA